MAEGNPKNTYKDVYHYGLQYDIDATHARIIETGFRDLCIGVRLRHLIEIDGEPQITIEEMLQEIDWAKKVAKGNGSVGVMVYNETTRVGIDVDGIDRYYRSWEQRIPVMEAIASSGIDYYLIDSGESHYSSYKDITTFLLAQRGILEGISYGAYDGDGFCNLLDYNLLGELGFLICSDIYMNWSTDTAYLRSPCGWGYDNLITHCWLSRVKIIYNRQALDAVHRLLNEQGFTGYNLLSTYGFEGIMPDWAVGA